MRRFTPLFAALSLVAAAGMANASVLTTLDGYPAGQTDGQYYIGPATLTIGGVEYSGICYDALDQAAIGQSWQANVYGMVDLGAGAYFTNQPVNQYTTGYEQVSYLSTLFTPGNVAQWVDIQHTIWSVFDSAYTADPTLIAEANNAIKGGYDFSAFRYIDSPPGSDPLVQGFIVDNANIGLTPQPEPATWFLFCSGFLLLAAWNLRRRAASRKA